MLATLKKILEAKCPECHEPLSPVNDALCSAKVCPHGHYKEENYFSLGVRFIYLK